MLHIWKHWHFSQTVSFIKSQPISKPQSSPVQFDFGAKQNIETLVLWEMICSLQAHATLPSLAGGWENNTAKATLEQSGMASFSHVDCDSIFLLNLTELFFFYSGAIL